MNSVLANLNARAFVVESMAPEAADRGPFGSGQNPFEKKRKQTSTATSSGAGPSSRDRAQVRPRVFRGTAVFHEVNRLRSSSRR